MHRAAQAKGRADIFKDYRLRIAVVIRDYGLNGSKRRLTAVSSMAKHQQVTTVCAFLY
jgi:hypothetical protein